MHRIVSACIHDADNKMQYLEVFDVIIDNIVTWWCIKNNLNIPYENENETSNSYREEAIDVASRVVQNNEGMSVYDLAFALGCSEILSRLLMMPCVRYFICEDGDVRTHIFDISDIIPRTKLISKACSATKALESNKSFQPKRKSKETVRHGMVDDM